VSKRARVLAVLACAALLSGCGERGTSIGSTGSDRDGSGASTGQESESPFVTAGDEVMLACGSGPKFAASAMEGGVTGLADEAEVAAALKRLAAEAGSEAPLDLQRVDTAEGEWIVLGSETDDGTEELIVGVGGWGANGPSDDGQYVTLDRVDGGWRASGWGDCNLAPVLAPGLSWAELALPDEGLDRAATSLEVEVHERECTSSRNPEPFLNEPDVVESEDNVTVYWTSNSPEGDQTCPGNPSVKRVVQLDAPLGDRALLDGSTWPPKPVSRF
jgi:hypothetical protein